MAAHLPTSLANLLEPRRFRRGSPVVSGDLITHLPYGTRSLSSAANHAYVYRLRSLGGFWDPDDAAFLTDAATVGWQDLTQEIDLEDGESVILLRATVFLRRGRVRLAHDQGAGWLYGTASAYAGAGTTGLTVDSAVLVDVTGVRSLVKLQYERAAGYTCEVFGFEVWESNSPGVLMIP